MKKILFFILLPLTFIACNTNSETAKIYKFVEPLNDDGSAAIIGIESIEVLDHKPSDIFRQCYV